MLEDEAISRWKALIESAVDGMIVIDSEGLIEAFNPAAERLFGYQESEVHGQNVHILMPSPDRDDHDRYMSAYLATGSPKIIGAGRDATGLRRDGSTFPIHLSVGEMRQGSERKFTGIIHDLTERTEMEARLREQTAMARLGEMAALIAHEVKNPLAAIRAGVQTLDRALPDDSDAHDNARQILTRIDALANLLREMLLFARPPQPRSLLVRIDRLIASTADFLKGDPAMAEVDVAIRGTAAPITGDPDLLKIVFFNLLINGGQAINGRGRIDVGVEERDGICDVIVTDSGPGIPVDARARLFTPFFTTKSRGTGLGLATAKRLVEAHGGSIRMDCPDGGGTRVMVRLPRNRSLVV